MTTPDDPSLSEITHPPIARTSEEPRRVRFVCPNCHAEDFVKLFHHEATPGIINCWQCKAGQGVGNLQVQMANKLGMLPAPVQEEQPN